MLDAKYERADAAVPPCNRSRLIALGLVELKDAKLVLSERGIRALAAT